MTNFDQFNNPNLDYLNQLKQFTTNPRNQGKQIYKNYRNEGVSNYPHMQDYERNMAQQAEQGGEEQGIKNEYEANKNKLIQDEEARFKAMTTKNERLRQEQAIAQQKKDLESLYPSSQVTPPTLSFEQQQMANIKKGGAWFTPRVRGTPTPAKVTPTPAVIAPKAPIPLRPSPQGIQYPPGTQFAPSNWRNMPPWSYPRGTLVMGSPGEVVSYSGTPPSWYS